MIKLALNSYISGAGKDTVADYLCEKHGFKKYALSDGIYEIKEKYFGIKDKDRPLLHHIGEKLREKDILIWINYTLRRIEEEGHDRVVITDVRKLLEHAYLKEAGWDNVMVYCSPEVAIERLKARDGENQVNEELVLNSELESQLRPLVDHMKVWDNTQPIEEVQAEVDAYIKYLSRMKK